jgi:predicted nucleic acid-binding protein
MIYLDSCAIVKLVVAESESAALREFLAGRPDELPVTSALARVEVVRAMRNLGGAAADAAVAVLAQIDQMPLVDPLLDAAGAGGGVLRSLDAIHLASATALEDGLTAFVTYDKRLAAAAADIGLPVHAPA